MSTVVVSSSRCSASPFPPSWTLSHNGLLLHRLVVRLVEVVLDVVHGGSENRKMAKTILGLREERSDREKAGWKLSSEERLHKCCRLPGYGYGGFPMGWDGKDSRTAWHCVVDIAGAGASLHGLAMWQDQRMALETAIPRRFDKRRIRWRVGDPALSGWRTCLVWELDRHYRESLHLPDRIPALGSHEAGRSWHGPCQMLYHTRRQSWPMKEPRPGGEALLRFCGSMMLIEEGS